METALLTEVSVCRFCAEQKPLHKMYNLQTNSVLNQEIHEKLNCFNTEYLNINLSKHRIYPTAVCLVCYSSLGLAYNFLKQVKLAQSPVKDILDTSIIVPDIATANIIKTEFSADTLIKNQAGPSLFEVALCGDKEVLSGEIELEPKTESDVLGNVDLCNKIELKGNVFSTEEFEINIESEPVADEQHESNVFWLCRFCNMQFSRITHLREHSMSVHKTCNSFKCSVCDSCYEHCDFNGFIAHMQTHFQSLRKICIYCQETFTTLSEANTHMKVHLKRKHACVHCGAIFRNVSDLMRHKNTYSVSSSKSQISMQEVKTANKEAIQKSVTCARDKYLYSVSSSKSQISTQEVKTANKEAKQKSVIYTCDMCGKIFRRKCNIVMHLKAHTRVKKKKSFDCKICAKNYRCRGRLMYHVAQHHKLRSLNVKPKRNKLKEESLSATAT